MYVQRLREEIEKYCLDKDYDLVKAKKIILGNKEAINDWVENTKILEKENRLDSEYYHRTVKGILDNDDIEYFREIQKIINEINKEFSNE